MLACLMVTVYILFCMRLATRPCKYFQLNARFFDRETGIFSKIGIDRLIPPPWRLAQFYDDGMRQPERYPVFVKPEWSQNARGVYRADNAGELRRIREKISAKSVAVAVAAAAPVAYLIQEGAAEANEYEIFSIQHHRQPARYAVLTVTQARNDSEANPVNSIYNANTRYVEITGSFSASQLDELWALVRRIGAFKISRLSVRADSTDDLLRGHFHVIEVNLFLPMPINLLDARYAWRATFALVRKYMCALALATKYRHHDHDTNTRAQPVFIKSMLYNRRGKLLNALRARL